MLKVNYWKILKNLAYANPKLNQHIKLDYYTRDLLITFSSINPLEVERYCAKNIKMIKNKFIQLIDEDNKRGVTPPLLLDSTYQCKWTPNNQSQEAVWRFRKSLLNKLHSLNDDSFEALCCFVLECMNGISYRTRTQKDGGIDGYGILTGTIDNHIFGFNKYLKIVGQFKNYNHPESITNFESFIQTLNNVRHMSSRVTKEMPSFFSSANGPIIGWYVCKGGFQRQVYDGAKWHGIILSDLIDIVEVLCKLKVYPFGNQETKLLLKIYFSMKSHLQNN